MSSVSPRDASLEVQRPLRNEQGDNLEQPKKNTISTSFFLFLRAQKRAASVDLLCWTGASACHCLFSAFNLAFKSQSISAMDRLQPDACSSCPFSSFCLDLFEIAQRLVTLYRRFALICKPRSAIGFFFFFFFFLLSIAQRIGSKPPPSHMKVLSFVRDVRTFEMTPYKALMVLRVQDFPKNQQCHVWRTFTHWEHRACFTLGVGSKTFSWCLLGSAAKSGQTSSFGQSAQEEKDNDGGERGAVICRKKNYRKCQRSIVK